MIGRVIIISVAAVIGATLVFMFVPTVQQVPVNPDMPVFEQPNQWTPPTDKLPKMSEDRRRDRAEDLIGEPMQYISPGRLITAKSIIGRGPEAMERAMDECFLLTDEMLSARHFKEVQDLIDSGVPESEIGRPKVFKSQLQSCKNIAEAYNQTHG
jgi:hypothetical protein